MGKIKVKIKLEIGFYDSFFFGGGNGLGEIQSYMQKDIQGLPYISGSALKGSMAAYAAVLSDFFKSGKRRTILFGTGGNAKGILYFENGKLEEKEAYEEMSGQTFGYKTQVSINPYTGTKSYKKLQIGNKSFQNGKKLLPCHAKHGSKLDIQDKILISAGRRWPGPWPGWTPRPGAPRLRRPSSARPSRPPPGGGRSRR